ncbi:MAG: hypothetical protein DMG15_18015 [Acidobacteria bacterium]|nr:MAG: hypothetical protein DMG15_18015 [Acidobacteriota bacterium]
MLSCPYADSILWPPGFFCLHKLFAHLCPVLGELASLGRSAWKGFLSDVLVGWIGKWLNLPELGFWHQELPESVAKTNEGEIRIKYEGAA